MMGMFMQIYDYSTKNYCICLIRNGNVGSIIAKSELVEDFPCDNKEQLRQREGWYIQNNPCVNKRVAGRSVQESYRYIMNK
jgi:hypothetical protein